MECYIDGKWHANGVFSHSRCKLRLAHQGLSDIAFWHSGEQSLYPIGTDDYTDSPIISTLSSLIIYFDSFQFSVVVFYRFREQKYLARFRKTWPGFKYTLIQHWIRVWKDNISHVWVAELMVILFQDHHQHGNIRSCDPLISLWSNIFTQLIHLGIHLPDIPRNPELVAVTCKETTQEYNKCSEEYTPNSPRHGCKLHKMFIVQNIFFLQMFY